MNQPERKSIDEKDLVFGDRPPGLMPEPSGSGKAPHSKTDPVPEENPIQKTEQVRRAKRDAKADIPAAEGRDKK
ncbi:MAG: hypothetical protein ACFB8W_15615 [Elainellaceae cyanobacterium]